MKIFFKHLKHFFFILDNTLKNFKLVMHGHVLFGKVTATGVVIENQYGKVPTVDYGYYYLDELIQIYENEKL